LAVLSIAAPSYADSDLKLSMSCAESVADDLDKSRIIQRKIGKQDLIESCLSDIGVPPEIANVSDYRVIFDYDVEPAGELRVVRRDDAVMCSLSELAVFVEAPSPAPVDFIKGRHTVIALHEWRAGDAGRMLCTQVVRKRFFCKKQGPLDLCLGKFKSVTKRSADCEGSVLFNDLPCSMKLKSKLKIK
jgi:hypothetical protein